jgi:hypothetical protein
LHQARLLRAKGFISEKEAAITATTPTTPAAKAETDAWAIEATV